MDAEEQSAGNRSPIMATEHAPASSTDRAFSLLTAKGKTLNLTYWDLWFALIAARDFGGDLLRLARPAHEFVRARFIAYLRAPSS